MYNNNKIQLNVVNNPIVDSLFSLDANEKSSNPPPPDNNVYWISNVGDLMISDTTVFLTFGGMVPPPNEEFWIDSDNDYMVDSDGDFFVFGD